MLRFRDNLSSCLRQVSGDSGREHLLGDWPSWVWAQRTTVEACLQWGETRQCQPCGSRLHPGSHTSGSPPGRPEPAIASPRPRPVLPQGYQNKEQFLLTDH